MSSYSEKLSIHCVHADPGSCMCIIYFLDSKCDTFSLLANTHDPENRFQKLNKIHRRRPNHWNCHRDSLTFVARSQNCYQALDMFNAFLFKSNKTATLLWAILSVTENSDFINITCIFKRNMWAACSVSHFESYLGFGLTQVDGINCGTTKHVVCPTQWIPCLRALAAFGARASAGVVLTPEAKIFRLKH